MDPGPNIVNAVAASPLSGFDIGAIRPGRGQPRLEYAPGFSPFSILAAVVSLFLHGAALSAILASPTSPPMTTPPEAIRVEIVAEQPQPSQPEPTRLIAAPLLPKPPSASVEPPTLAEAITPPTVPASSPPLPRPPSAPVEPPTLAEATPPPTVPAPSPRLPEPPSAPVEPSTLAEASPPPTVPAPSPRLPKPPSAPVEPPAIAEATPPATVPAPSPPLPEPPSAPVEPPAIAEAASPPAAPTPTAETPVAPDLTAAPIAPVAPPLAKPQNSSVGRPPPLRPTPSTPQPARRRGEPTRDAAVLAPPQSGRAEAKQTKLVSIAPKTILPAASSTDLADYQRVLYSRISAVKRYPDSARERAPHGVVIVSFSIDASGRLTAVSINQSAGDANLDAEALTTLRRASPFPPPPAGSPRTFSAPLSFKAR
jgi:TonB family protein